MTVTRGDQLAVVELGKRSMAGTFGHVLMLLTAQLLAPNAHALPLALVWGWFGVMLVARVAGYHFAIHHPERSVSLWLVALGSIGCNLVWGMVTAGVAHKVGYGLPMVTYFAFLCGIASASVNALAPKAWLQRSAFVLLLVPTMIFGLVDGMPAFTLLFGIFLVFSWFLGTAATRDFWTTARANAQLRVYAADQERAALAAAAMNVQLRDETAQRLQMEVELRQAQKLEAIGRLAAGIAHEINTPVQFVTDSCTFISEATSDVDAILAEYHAMLDDLARGRITGEQALAREAELESTRDITFLRENLRESAARSLDGLARVTKIVRATKEFAAQRARAKAPANLNSAIETTLVICRHETDAVADVETELGSLPAVMCHGDELNQVFLNIIVNAAYAIGDVARAPATRGKIRIKTWATNDAVKVAISDTGGGISPEVLDKIFDPFFTTKPVGKGSGQGLSIARSIIVGKHGGTLDVTSDVGVGTTFTIGLPV